MPPERRPFPRFIADASKEGPPYGRFAEILAGHFAEACEAIEDLPGGAEAPAEIEWFPERAWGGRVWVPAIAHGSTEEGDIEYFGHVSYVQPTDGEPRSFSAKADFTDVFAEDNPEWRIDLNDEVIGRWVGESTFAGEVTLIWGKPLVRGATAVTAELEDQSVDQQVISDERFTLIACDAMQGFGDPVYVEIKLWNRSGAEIASESLYEDESADAEGDGPDTDDAVSESDADGKDEDARR